MHRVPTAICVLLSTGLLIKIVLLVRAGERVYSWETYLLCTALFLLLLPVCLRLGWKAGSPSGIAVAWWASWSYSLYLLHHSIFLDYFMPISRKSAAAGIPIGTTTRPPGGGRLEACCSPPATIRTHERMGGIIGRGFPVSRLASERLEKQMIFGRHFRNAGSGSVVLLGIIATAAAIILSVNVFGWDTTWHAFGVTPLQPPFYDMTNSLQIPIQW